MMEINFSETKYKTVNISRREAIRITIETLRIEFDIPERSWIEGGCEDETTVIMKNVERSGGSHSWDEKKVHRVAAPGDKRVLDVISYLEDKAREI